MNVPFFNLTRQYSLIGEEINREVVEVLRSGAYVSGDKVKQFEREFAKYCGTAEAVAVNSGTSALHLALLAAGVGSGDEVITVSSTFIATAHAIRLCGATPVFVDVDDATLTMDVSKIEEQITPKTKVILPVHLHGHPADMSAIKLLAEKHTLKIVEDSAQAHGSSINDVSVGTIGEFGCFSFYPGKNLGGVGEGGAVVTSNSQAAQRIREMRDWGQKEKYVHGLHAFNYRMDNIQAAALCVKLSYLESWTERRREVATIYTEELKTSGVSTPIEKAGCRHVYHIYCIRTKKRGQLIEQFKKSGIGFGIHYPIPVHLQEGFLPNSWSQPGSLEVTERAAKEILSLPMFPEINESEVNQVIELLKAFN